MRKLGTVAGIAAALVLVVVAASAAIRNEELSASVALARGVHRAAASLAALAVFALAWMSWKQAEVRSAALVALILTLALSAIGVATGTEPPRPAAFANQTGGIALAALLAWIYGRSTPGSSTMRAARSLASVALAVATLQAFGGATLATFWKDAPAAVFMLHAAAGLAAALLLAALGPRYAALAVLAPLLGAAAVVTEVPGIALVLHALAAATLLAATAHARGRASA